MKRRIWLACAGVVVATVGVAAANLWEWTGSAPCDGQCVSEECVQTPWGDRCPSWTHCDN